MDAFTTVVPQLPFVALLAIAPIINTVVNAVMRLKMLNRALEGTKPKERPGIIRELRGLWKSDWQLGPLRRIKPSKPRDDADDGSEPPKPDQ